MERLSVELELVYYDRPLCRLVCDDDGFHYLAILLDGEDREVWFLARVEFEIIEKLLGGEFDLRTAVEQSCSQQRFLAFLELDDGGSLQAIDVSIAPSLSELDDELPGSGFMFEPDEFGEYIRRHKEGGGDGW